MEVGGVFALSTEREFRVAERISQMVPAAELVRFSNSGTEAVMAGLRLARRRSRVKDDYVILEGGYHGLFDAAMWYTPMDKWAQVVIRMCSPTARASPSARVASRTSCKPTTRISSRTSSSAKAARLPVFDRAIMGNCLGIAAEPEYLRAARELCDSTA